ncbi:hypothetical protein [Hamadaea tsunoensis]|uniref:hypothetical protein n=1 Tax=Hamadaea tsunoensis TaxID=53368 RepID=UPI0004257B76|nr:hypothetical protein [Hamadaea tsunoensis]
MTSLGEPVAKRRVFGQGALIVLGWCTMLAAAGVTASASVPARPCDGEGLCFDGREEVVLGLMIAVVLAGVLLALGLGLLALLVRWVRSPVWAGVIASVGVTALGGCVFAISLASPR